MKNFYRVFTHNDEFFDFPSSIPMINFVINGRVEGGFLQEGIFVPFSEMRLVVKIQTHEPTSPPATFMTPAGQA
jgi:hypothetical protein